jgi:N-acetylglucosaminyldiphosphoundecaprenol N-acetyl-beta-D-mannosaminyltransferase
MQYTALRDGGALWNRSASVCGVLDGEVTMGITRITFDGIPVDICRPENLEAEVLELLAKPGTKQIVFLSVWNLLKARRNSEYRECIRNADLVLPVSASIIRSARFLKKSIPVRYNPFSAVIDILSVLESHYRSAYLLGARKKTLMKAEANVRSTFPTLQIVGRYIGYYPRTSESAVVEAIYKASPSLVLVSEGIKEKDLWAYRRRNQFSSSIFIYYHDALGIFSERIKRVDENTFRRGLEIVPEVIHNPLKIFLIFPYLWYIIVTIWYRMVKK